MKAGPRSLGPLFIPTPKIVNFFWYNCDYLFNTLVEDNILNNIFTNTNKKYKKGRTVCLHNISQHLRCDSALRSSHHAEQMLYEWIKNSNVLSMSNTSHIYPKNTARCTKVTRYWVISCELPRNYRETSKIWQDLVVVLMVLIIFSFIHHIVSN